VFILQFLLWYSTGRNSDKAVGTSSLRFNEHRARRLSMPYSDMWQNCQSTLQHTRPCYAKSSYRSVDPHTLHGNVHQIDHVPNRPTNSAAITIMFPLRLCGGKLLVAVRADYALRRRRRRARRRVYRQLADWSGLRPVIQP